MSKIERQPDRLAEYKEMISLSVGLIAEQEIDGENHVLLVQQRDGRGWGIPAGHVEQYEDSIEGFRGAIGREFLEETGRDLVEMGLRPRHVDTIFLEETDRYKIGIIGQVELPPDKEFNQMFLPSQNIEIYRMRMFSPAGIRRLLFPEKHDVKLVRIYKPEFNRPVLEKWLATQEAANTSNK